MDVSKKEYEKYIQPFFDKVYKLKNIDKVDEILVGDILVCAAKSEFDFEKLKEITLSLTEIQKRFLIRNGIKDELDNLIAFFNKINH